MLAPGGYKLKMKEAKKVRNTLAYQNSMPPEVVLEELYDVVPVNFIERYAEEKEIPGDDYFNDFERGEIMYPSMMKPLRKQLYEQRQQGWQAEKLQRAKIKRDLHARFILDNPELELAQRLRKTQYGRELLEELDRERGLISQPASGTEAELYADFEQGCAAPEVVKGNQVVQFYAGHADKPFSQLETEHDEDGRIRRKVLSLYPKSYDIQYDYDAGGRLREVLCDGRRVEHYQYGKSGERLSGETHQKPVRAFRYGEGLQLLQAGDVKYSYDGEGRLILKQDKGQVTRYTYLESGPLHEVFLPDERRIEYLCDPAGRRIAKSVNGRVTEKYLWEDLSTLTAVTDGEGMNAKELSYSEEGDPVTMTYRERTYHFASDQVGSIYMVADDNGNELKRVIYDSFGNIIVDSDERIDIPLGFAAGLFDKDTGLIHFGYREYDPETGRFTTPESTVENVLGDWGRSLKVFGSKFFKP
ncbi:RHS repeat domain-containing protein [Maridesulfovibrio hydrothermalis]|uniref:YD repeat protein n=1 Tax=Maridesulfovibrio hydrothermalis AM13 = DSM 14728 TaxID=1121451 RepID=L0R9F6_9BACT